MKQTYFLKLFVTVFFILTGMHTFAGDSLRIMSFNTRYTHANDGADSWPVRKELLLKTIADNAPDILCLQEATPDMLRAIGAAFPEFMSYGLGRDSILTEYTESCHIFYRSMVFSIDSANSGTFWFSNTPNVAGSKGWGANHPRICTFARFTSSKSGRGFSIYNLHWDHESVEARNNSSRMLAESISSRPFPSEACFVAGDFNATDDDSSVSGLLDGKHHSIKLTDAFSKFHKHELPEESITFHGFSGKGTNRIDFIFYLYGNSIEVRNAIIEKYNENNRYPSDHFPVICDFVFLP
ncbi:MAG: endonuclease/exonuclease/phosphatase family protein [Bacteroidales bacterium]|nr:endonuclease/exonuclease/phosphatase family protein [Bacteroidales bacterium]